MNQQDLKADIKCQLCPSPRLLLEIEQLESRRVFCFSCSSTSADTHIVRDASSSSSSPQRRAVSQLIFYVAILQLTFKFAHVIRLSVLSLLLFVYQLFYCCTRIYEYGNCIFRFYRT